MKNNVITIMKKEFARFFGDKRMVFTSVLLPGIIIYAMYSFMGQGMSEQFDTSDKTYNVSIANLPASMEMITDIDKMNVTDIKDADVEEAKEDLTNETTDLVIVFPENFDEKMIPYDASKATEAAPNIEVYLNSASTTSSAAYSMFESVADQVESSMANKFDVNAGDKEYDVATDEDQMAQFFAMLMPMLIMMFLFSGCLGIAAESIAGEKERGTIATLLVTPMKRSQLALGKMLSLSVMGILSGLSSFVGIMLSLPKMVQGMGEDASISNVYQPSDYVLLLFVILTATLLMVGLISIISALAKTIKEASTAVMPLMIIVMVLAISTMMGKGTPTEFYWYLIPLYNNVQCLSGIFSMDFNIVNIVITVVSDVIYAGVLVGVLSKLFNSERIMYTQ